MSEAEMRKAIKNSIYSSEKWTEKVNKMSKQQVYMVYQNLKKKNLLK